MKTFDEAEDKTAWIKSAWEKINDAPDQNAEIDQCGRFLLALANLGPDSDQISKAAGLSADRVRELCQRATEAEILVEGTIHHSGWLDEETGGIAFIMDAMVLDGTIKRVFEAAPSNA